MGTGTVAVGLDGTSGPTSVAGVEVGMGAPPVGSAGGRVPVGTGVYVAFAGGTVGVVACVPGAGLTAGNVGVRATGDGVATRIPVGVRAGVGTKNDGVLVAGRTGGVLVGSGSSGSERGVAVAKKNTGTPKVGVGPSGSFGVGVRPITNGVWVGVGVPVGATTSAGG